MKRANNLPTPPTLWQTLGPSFILLGLALGSGELILWPYLAARYGLGLIWGAVLGITFQFVLNTEVMRYTLYRGESVFVGFARLSRWLPIWFVISTAIPWSIPGFSSASANIIHHLLPQLSEKLIAILLLLITGFLLSVGKSLYKTMEVLQKSIILIGLPLIVILTFWLARASDWVALAQGLVGIGHGWHFFPPGVAITAFLGAFAYAGAGGNLNLAQSYYIKEKGFGMGRFMPKISSLFSKAQVHDSLVGREFAHSTLNQRRWQAWWQLVNIEHLIVFFGLGLASIILLSVLAYATVFSDFSHLTQEGLAFLFFQAQSIGVQTHAFFSFGFLIVATLMLFATQVGVLESAARIISENLALIAHKPGQKVNLTQWFYIALWTQILLGVVMYVVGLTEPRFLLTLSAVLNAAAMMISFILMQILNKKQLRKTYRAGKARRLVMMLAVLFFLYFLVLTVFQN